MKNIFLQYEDLFTRKSTLNVRLSMYNSRAKRLHPEIFSRARIVDRVKVYYFHVSHVSFVTVNIYFSRTRRNVRVLQKLLKLFSHVHWSLLFNFISFFPVQILIYTFSRWGYTLNRLVKDY